MADAPETIRSLSEESALELVWNPSRTSKIPFRLLRESCPCANCVDEMTGEKILDVSTIPDDIHPKRVGFSGNYALKILWSDEHHTGLFTWEYLDELCQRLAESKGDNA